MVVQLLHLKQPINPGRAAQYYQPYLGVRSAMAQSARWKRSQFSTELETTSRLL